ncbi:MAG: transposase family protein [Proteobacteria bacterium]|nr:transposase family protein [Pseudomonadota bacterium]
MKILAKEVKDSPYNVILNLPGFTVTKVSGPNPLVIHAKYYRKPKCPYCGNSKLRKKDAFFRQLKHESLGHRNTVLRFKAFKFYCKACHRYFHQQFPGILKHQRATEKLKQQIFKEPTQGASQTDLSTQGVSQTDFSIGYATSTRS